MIVNDENVERVARAMCKAKMQNPDQEVFIGIPVLVQNGYTPIGPARPAWTMWADEARLALMEMLSILEDEG